MTHPAGGSDDDDSSDVAQEQSLDRRNQRAVCRGSKLGKAIGVRDSQRPGCGHITLTSEAFTAMLRQIKGVE